MPPPIHRVTRSWQRLSKRGISECDGNAGDLFDRSSGEVVGRGRFITVVPRSVLEMRTSRTHSEGATYQPACAAMVGCDPDAEEPDFEPCGRTVRQMRPTGGSRHAIHKARTGPVGLSRLWHMAMADFAYRFDDCSTTGLKVRFFSVRIATNHGRTGRLIGSSFRSVCGSFASPSTDLGTTVMNRPRPTTSPEDRSNRSPALPSAFGDPAL